MKKILCLVLSIIALVSAVLPGTTVAFAKDPVITKNINYTDFKTYSDIIKKDGYQRKFTLSADSVLYADFKFALSEKKVGNSYAKKLDGKNGIRLYIISLDGDAQKIVQKSDILLSKNKYTETRQFTSTKVLPAGKYTVFAIPLRTNYIAQIMKINFRLFTYGGFAQQAKLKSTASVYTDATKRLSLTELSPSNTISGARWQTSDKTVAKIVLRDKNYVDIIGVKPGTCDVTATLKDGTQYVCKVKVKNPTVRISEKSLVLQNKTASTLKMLYTKRKVVWKSDDTEIATVSKNGRVVAKGVGNCKITARCGGKNYICKLKVVMCKPDFAATLAQYDKKGNFFVVKYSNYGVKPLKIISKGAACIADKDSYDRHLHLKGNKDIVINPGKSKTVKFYVKGKTTSAKISRYGIMYRFKYAGEERLAGVWCEDSTYRLGKKWKPTYKYEADMCRIQGTEYGL